jgi:hypothetical protein
VVLSGCRHNNHRGAYGKGKRPLRRRLQLIRSAELANQFQA